MPATNRSLFKRDTTQSPRDPSGSPAPLELLDRMDRATSAIWAEMGAWTPEQRRANLPPLLNAIRRLETRLMVLRMSVTREIAGVYELVKPARVGVVPDEDENEGD